MIECSHTSPEEQQILNAEFLILSKRENLLPIKLSKHYKALVDEEVKTLGHTDGPLHRTAYPSKERLNVRAPGEVPDFVDDRENMPEDHSDAMVRKYDDRMLFFPTSECLGNCQYCFRQDVLSEQREDEDKMLERLLEELVDYVNTHEELKEVILSGGDPLILPFKKLQQILDTIKLRTKIESIRVHTRAMAFAPQVFSEEKAKLFGEHRVRMVSHIVHPYEITDATKQAMEALQNQRVRLYNQFPLLRGVNDHSKVLIQLLKQLDEQGVRNLSVFIPDPINYSAAFRLRLSRIFSLIDEVNWNSPSWVNSTRFVLDTQKGKVRREDLQSYDNVKEIATFVRNGQAIEYPDLPSHLDVPGNLPTMLWKSSDKI